MCQLTQRPALAQFPHARSTSVSAHQAGHLGEEELHLHIGLHGGECRDRRVVLMQRGIQLNGGVGDQGVKKPDVVAESEADEILKRAITGAWRGPRCPVRAQIAEELILLGLVPTPLDKLHHNNPRQQQLGGAE